MRMAGLLVRMLAFLCWAVRRLVELVVLMGRGERTKELEIGVLRTQEEGRGEWFGFSAAVLCGRWGFGAPGSRCRGRLQTSPRCGG